MIKELGLRIYLSSADLLYVLSILCERSNSLDGLDGPQSITPWILENKLSGLVAKVVRTY